MSWLQEQWRHRRGVMIFVLLLIAAGGVLAGTRLARSEPAVPTVEVSTGEFVAHLPLRGELKALKSMVLIAPSYSGDLQIIKLVKNGTPVKKGDVVAVFDSTNLERQLGQRQTELRQAESEIERTRAQGNMVEEQNRTELIRAQYAVERAKLETTKAEILSEIEGAKNRLLLANAEKKMKEVEQKLASDKTANAADLESRRQRRDKAKREVGEFERRIAALTLLAPADGVVNLLPNFRAGGPFTQAPEFKEGDRAWPGAAVAELPDMNTLRAIARVEEIDRGRLEKGQTAVVRVDAIPEKEFPARIVAISPMAKPDFSSWPPQRTFDIEFQLDGTDPRMRPGMSANAQVAVERLPGSVLVPPEAVFQKNGRTIVYVLRGGKFEEQEIAVLRRSGTQVAVARGAKPGDKLAKRDPTLTEDAVK